MCTIVKNRGKEKTYVTCTVEQIRDYIQQGTYRFEKEVPMIRFAADFHKAQGQLVMDGYCGLVVLKVGNLRSMEEVARVMQHVSRIPHTCLAWRDAATRSVYVLCRLEWTEDLLPSTPGQMLVLQRNGYKLAYYLYATQLVVKMDTEDPRLEAETPYAYDAELYFNANSIPFYVDGVEVDVPKPIAPDNSDNWRTGGMDAGEFRSYTFHCCYRRALQEGRQHAADELGWKDKVVDLVAGYCFDAGLPIGYALSHARLVMRNKVNVAVLEQAFENAYAEELLKEVPFGSIPKTALLTLQTEAFLHTYYLLRRNVLTGEVQYRERSAYAFEFRPLTEQVMNSMTLRALKVGLGSWDKDMKRLINSNDIPQYDPLEEYLFALPQWDGKDRVGELAARIPVDDFPGLPHYLHIWLLGMVAHWMGKDSLHGNAIVPIIIGGQGCGKTTFASLLLPPELRDYYNDKVDFRSDSDLMSGLSRFALINIDEFDAVKKSQQPTLKYLLSKGELKFRPAYGKTIEHRHRYASFIATTNLAHPLVDRTGSRRFICIQVSQFQLIDNLTPISYDQLYAQLFYEINHGERYWFDDKETEEIQEHNSQYLRMTNLSDMLDALLLPPAGEAESAVWTSLDEILTCLVQAYPYLTVTNATYRDMGKLLREKGYEHQHTRDGMRYRIRMRA